MKNSKDEKWLDAMNNFADYLRTHCPKLAKLSLAFLSVNRIFRYVEDEYLSQYTMLGKTIGIKMPILRDSSARIDVVQVGGHT